ncbi:ProQ/FinO family protein [Cupriavidus pauculus]|uniref:ProQ/FinO family protein n=1 Tax=Cupriavidus pauculus TaxID=82633 RepID=UPI001EE3220A|nr:ProQ/FinO family protein [Cupriavidus pauculus]GJG97879.1 hypothetical protein CBA19C6_25340 [Cupriavidus pauculus]
MGFEQLAALKAKLAEQAKNEARAKAPPRGRPAPSKAGPATGKAKPATSKPNQGARKPNPAAAKAAPATPVDPVVRNIGKLQKRFPAVFPKNPAPKVPLKVGIFDDLMTQATELGLNEAELRDAIRTWCRGARYWACLTEGAQRLDLNGQPAGEVTAADAARGRQLRAGRAKQEAAKNKDAAGKPQTPQQAQPQAQPEAKAAAQPEAAADVPPAAPEAQPSQPE